MARTREAAGTLIEHQSDARSEKGIGEMTVLASPRVWGPVLGVVVVLALIFYAYLAAVVSPQENLEDLPIALVNEDSGADLALAIVGTVSVTMLFAVIFGPAGIGISAVLNVILGLLRRRSTPGGAAALLPGVRRLVDPALRHRRSALPAFL
jgi:hypothetical protein